MDKLAEELDRRWRRMFGALADGGDVPPSQRLRTEGLMEAAVLLELVTEQDLLTAMDSCYTEVFGRAMAEDFGIEWFQFYPFPQIPAVMRRAPVYPSTPD